MDDAYYIKLTEEFKKSKEAIDAMTKRQDAMKKELIEALKEKAYQDDKGHLWWELGDFSLKYERRVSRNLDYDAAKEWAHANNLWDELKEVVEILSEDKLLGYAWNHREVEDVIQGFYVEKESWAFKS